MIIYTVVGASIALQLALNPMIDFKNYGVMIRDLSNACITICSITIATILGIMAIITTRSTNNKIQYPLIDIIIFPIYGVLFGFLSIYTSYFEDYFYTSKFLNGITIMLTITSVMSTIECRKYDMLSETYLFPNEKVYRCPYPR